MPGRWLTTCVLLVALAQPALAGEIYRYEAPDGSLAFTDRAPTGVKVVEKVVPSDARRTRVDRIAPSYHWTQMGYAEQERAARFGAAAEAQRRQIEDAAVLETLANEEGIGRGAAAVNRANAERRMERLEDACRRSGCTPGSLR